MGCASAAADHAVGEPTGPGGRWIGRNCVGVPTELCVHTEAEQPEVVGDACVAVVILVLVSRELLRDLSVVLLGEVCPRVRGRHRAAWRGEGLPALTATSVLVPTFHGLALVLSAHVGRPVDADGVRVLLKEEGELKVLDDVASDVCPVPMLTTDDPAIHVGRGRAHGPLVLLVACVDGIHWRGDARAGAGGPGVGPRPQGLSAGQRGEDASSCPSRVW